MSPNDLKYTKEQTWVRVSGSEGVVGITDYAQKQLGSVLFVEVKQPGDKVTQSQPCGTIESDKATSDIICPVSGEVTAVNKEALDSPETINSSPYSSGWLFKLKISNLKELDKLLSAEAYDKLLATVQK